MAFEYKMLIGASFFHIFNINIRSFNLITIIFLSTMKTEQFQLHKSYYTEKRKKM